MSIIEIIIGFITGGGLMALFTIRPRRKQEEAVADKAKAEANSLEIENIGHQVDLYSKIIDDLNERLGDAMKAMRSLEEALEALKRENSALRLENERLKGENELLRAKLKKK